MVLVLIKRIAMDLHTLQVHADDPVSDHEQTGPFETEVAFRFQPDTNRISIGVKAASCRQNLTSFRFAVQTTHSLSLLYSQRAVCAGISKAVSFKHVDTHAHARAHKYTHTRTRAQIHTHTQARTHASARARMHTPIHKHTH